MDTRSYQNVFLGEVIDLKRRGIYIDRVKLKGMELKKKCKEESERFLGEELKEERVAKELLRELLKEKDFRLLSNAKTMCLSYTPERLWLILKQVEKRNEVNYTSVLGVIYYLMGSIIEEELERLTTLVQRGRGYIYPSYNLDVTSFRWSNYPEIKRKYILWLMEEEGYEGYYYEKDNLTLVTYMSSIGLNGEESDSYVRKLKGGLFIEGLKKEEEEKLSKLLLCGSFDSLTGLYASRIIQNNIEYGVRYGVESIKASVYNQDVLPLKIAFMGKVLKMLKEDRSREIEDGICKISYISEDRIGVLLKKGVKLEDVYPKMYKYLKKIPETLSSKGVVMKGLWF